MNIKSKPQTVILIHMGNKDFVDGSRFSPVNKDEIIDNLYNRSKLPKPWTEKKRSTFFVTQIVYILIALLLSIGTLLALILFPRLAFGSFILATVSFLFIAIAISLFIDFTNIAKTPLSYIDETYTELVKRHRIVTGVVYTSLRHKKREIRYCIEDDKTVQFSYFTNSPQNLQHGDKLAILYHTNKIHLPL